MKVKYYRSSYGPAVYVFILETHRVTQFYMTLEGSIRFEFIVNDDNILYIIYNPVVSVKNRVRR